METVKLSPRGYCHGVVNAINTITKLTELSNKKSITILGMVIHNKQVVNFFESKGIKTLNSTNKTRLELLDEVDDGIVVFTAHGVSPAVKEKAKQKGLEVIDTTCQDVENTQKVIIDLIADQYEIIYIGKHTHPESEAASGLSEFVHIVENMADVESLKLRRSKLAITNQTTMSLYDIYALSEKIKKVYPEVYFVDEICNATRIRQEAVRNQDSSIDHCYIVGDKLSNNSQNLAHVSFANAGVKATLIENIEDIDIEVLKQFNKVSISSGASTPTRITNEVISFFENFDKDDPATHDIKSKVTQDNLIPTKKRS